MTALCSVQSVDQTRVGRRRGRRLGHLHQRQACVVENAGRLVAVGEPVERQRDVDDRERHESDGVADDEAARRHESSPLAGEAIEIAQRREHRQQRQAENGEMVALDGVEELRARSLDLIAADTGQGGLTGDGKIAGDEIGLLVQQGRQQRASRQERLVEFHVFQLVLRNPQPARANAMRVFPSFLRIVLHMH